MILCKKRPREGERIVIQHHETGESYFVGRVTEVVEEGCWATPERTCRWSRETGSTDPQWISWDLEPLRVRE